MTGMEDVLAAHWPVYRRSPVYDAKVWACSTGLCDVLGDFEKVIKHQAAELEAAGFGNLHDAWAEGAVTALNHAIENDDGMTLRLEHLDGRPWTNPYPYPKVSET